MELAHVHEHSAELPNKLKPEKNESDDFAKILAGLSSHHNSDAEIEEALCADTAEWGEIGMVPAMFAAVTDGVPSSIHTHTDETEPALEKNMLFTIGRLTGQPEEAKGTRETASLHTGREPAAAAPAPASAIHSSRHSQEAVKTGTANAAASAQVNGEKAEKQTQTASTIAAAETAVNQKNNVEKGKTPARGNRVASSEKTTGEASFQRFQGKNTVSEAKEGASERRNRLEEVRNRRRGFTVEVQDFRTNGQAALAKEGEVSLKNGVQPGKDIVLELRLPNQGPASGTTSLDIKSGQALENFLARELHQNFNNDIVRHASVALHDRNEGTIRLAIKPESLGNVKIHLELAENKITGHIVVESEEALRAFKQEISSLEKAFRDSGFDAANLEMSLSADGSGQQWQEAEASQFLPGFIAAAHYDAAIERMEMPVSVDVYHQELRAINVFA
ncbi:MAG: flagellar hook-length control protein FliK [Treponema sp.]|nr:flagellar hook-length control protein FliK [Treponema sp.]